MPAGRKNHDLDVACSLARAAFDAYRDTPPAARATFRETIAQNMLDIGDALIQRRMIESGLPRARLEGKRGRTIGQLRMFADVVRNGDFIGARIRRNPTAPRCQA